MARYKTVIAAWCKNAHANLNDDRREVASAEESEKLALKKISTLPCQYCDSPLERFEVMGTEKLPPAAYTIFGYTCECGERVEVFRIQDDTGFTAPPVTLTFCSKGHSRKTKNEDALSLDRWREEPN